MGCVVPSSVKGRMSCSLVIEGERDTATTKKKTEMRAGRAKGRSEKGREVSPIPPPPSFPHHACAELHLCPAYGSPPPHTHRDLLLSPAGKKTLIFSPFHFSPLPPSFASRQFGIPGLPGSLAFHPFLSSRPADVSRAAQTVITRK